VNLGRFREDLLFRISRVAVEILALRKRMDDIELLLESIFEELGGPDVKIDDASLEMVKARSWRGNIREVKNLVEVALFGAKGKVISLKDALPAVQVHKKTTQERAAYDIAKREFERQYYVALYRQCRGSVARIARVSGRERSTVRAALRSLGLLAAPGDSPEEDGQEVAVLQ
jgi:DNA-binding NtrC family response regulator